jgi:hypothetical protein
MEVLATVRLSLAEANISRTIVMRAAGAGSLLLLVVVPAAAAAAAALCPLFIAAVLLAMLMALLLLLVLFLLTKNGMGNAGGTTGDRTPWPRSLSNMACVLHN